MTKMLIVDDNSQNLYMLQVLLAGNGFEVDTAANGVEALEKVHSNPPDLIVSDILMPKMDGFALCRACKQDPQLKDIPFIFYTATYTDPQHKEFALSLGAERFVIKPQEPDKFLVMIKETIEDHKAGRLGTANERIAGETEYYQQYSAALVGKLEGKVVQLEKANHALELEIAERKRAENALRESEERFRAIITNLGEGIGIVDENETFIYANPAADRIFGLPEGGVTGKSLEQFVDGVTYAKIKTTSRQAGEAAHYEIGIIRPGGDRRNVLVTSTARTSGDGAFIGTFGIFRDVTDRVQAEKMRKRLLEQIQTQARQMQQIIDTVPDSVLLLDAEGRVLLANPVGKRVLAEVADVTVGEFLTHLGPRSLEELLTSPPQGLWHEIQVDSRVFEVIARPATNYPNPERWVLVLHDATHERQVQDQLQQQERLAAVGQLAAGIAHDFNNIMAVMVLYAQMGLQTPNLPDKLHGHLHTIHNQARRATDLIQQIVDFSRSAALERRPLDLMPFVKELVKLLERTIPEHIAVSFCHGGDDYVVSADPTRIQQVVMNLALNARDAMPDSGELCFTLARVRVDDAKRTPLPDMAAGEWIRLTVEDSGSGIPSEALPHIFEPFYTTKAPGLGSGLGLAQVWGIVKQHEGHVDVVTEVGKGTRFIIFLPAMEESHPPPFDQTAKAFIRGQGEVILIVEDDTALREALVDTLELLNYRVVQAANGREALSVLEQNEKEIELVLSDLVMPEMGGEALFHAIRRRSLDTPVVIMSGHPMESELERLQADGLADWLLKPPCQETLAEAIASALNK